MKVLVIPAKKGNVHVHETEGALHDLQALVGGYIQAVPLVELEDEGITMLCNEEGLLMGLDPNENLYPFFFVGQCVMVGVSGEEFVSLTQQQIDFLQRWLQM